MKKANLLKEKINLLEKQIKKKEQLLKKYQLALDKSNQRIQKISENLDENLLLIREIHKILRPVKLPNIPGFELSYKFLPTKEAVSGDFFDIIEIQNSQSFGILLSSCNSYALTSLFVSSFLKRSPYLGDYKTATDFVSFVAKKISPALKQKDKLHLFYGLISKKSMELDYCLVGDIFAGCKKYKEKQWNILNSSAPYLYKDQIKKLKFGKINLQTRDILMLCSPGILNRENKNGKKFGKENIIKASQLVKANGVLEMRQNVLFSCKEFGKDTKQLQDFTILNLKVTKPVLIAK